ncbi:hypothetical protein, partial [Pseudomonas sp. KCJK8993]|uniref:hypothetical protein n=1 Tax=Pseudomonas sp. KCJK8993 TaxID=3344565 RepID=UPI003905F475
KSVIDREAQKRQGLTPKRAKCHAANLSFSFKQATLRVFAPSSQLFKRTTGALHCTGTVARGISDGYSRNIWFGSATQGRRNYKNYNSKSGAL